MVDVIDPPAESAPPTAWQLDLYMPFLQALPISGISISVVAQGRRESTICVSDVTSAEIDELQFALGEGPHWQAARTGLPYLIDNVDEADHSRWPIFGQAVKGLGVGALFAFPMMLGAAVVGVADMYRGATGGLNAGEVQLAQHLSTATAGRAVDRATRSAQGEWPRTQGIAPEMRREVQQATGMILVQLDVSATEAFSRLKAHAFVSGTSIQNIAHEVVGRRLDFRDLIE